MGQEDQSTNGEIRVEKIRDGESRTEQTYLRGMIRLEQSGVKASGETRGRSERSKNITEREEPFQKRKENSCEKIRAESDKSSAEQSVEISVV